MGSEAFEAFMAHVASFATVPVYWPNVSDDLIGPPKSDHFRVSVLPVDPEGVDTCGGSRYTWILQVSVFVRDGVGMVKPARLVDEIRAATPDGLRLTSNNYVFQTIAQCREAPPLHEGGWCITPVQCRFITLD